MSKAFLVGILLLAAPGVLDLHHLHVWALSTTSTALSVHLVAAPETEAAALVHELAHQLEHGFRIDHATIQVESAGSDTPCLLQPSSAVHLHP